jgi:hypothetical protein
MRERKLITHIRMAAYNAEFGVQRHPWTPCAPSTAARPKPSKPRSPHCAPPNPTSEPTPANTVDHLQDTAGQTPSCPILSVDLDWLAQPRMITADTFGSFGPACPVMVASRRGGWSGTPARVTSPCPADLYT